MEFQKEIDVNSSKKDIWELVKELLAKDPIKIMGAELIEKGIITKDEDDRINNSGNYITQEMFQI